MSEQETKPSAVLRAVTPSDTTSLKVTLDNGQDVWPRALWVGGAGNVAVLGQGDASAVTISSVPAGTVLPVRPRRVMSTNTTATNIVALY